MKRWLIRALLCTLPGTAFAERAVQSSPEQLRALQQRMEALRDELNQSESAHREARDELRSSEKAISDASRALRDIASRRKAVESALTQTRKDVAAGEERLRTQQSQLAQLLRGHQRAGEADALRHLLSGTDPNQSARDLHYLRSLSKSQLKLMDEHRATLSRQRELLAQQDAQLDEIRTLEAERERERGKLQSEHDVRRKVLDRIATQLRTERKELAQLKRDEARLSRLIESLSRRSARSTPPKTPAAGPADDAPAPAGRESRGPVVQSTPVDHGGVAFPKLRGRLPWPASGELARRFGAQGADGGTPLRGIFIRAAAGDVKAVAAGTVVFADWLRGFGNLVIVDHGDNYLSVYGNNEAVLKSVGATVRAGEVIASIGASGGASESGLYFELRHQGQALDPLKWVAR
ncbi:murein hydrolase activator EnvC family protein [Methyloversatilis discipulorum]|uniref:murein hydrolase activator EnvC family protein n=1 Tax=Methyloversatilis discipulorum TaxID=1119528 RepID=UPI001A534254|nr:peptidoglycan DD-metalloendopeptidase family protein [Methyloversatilis discipulorum]MBL8467818.1 peptidoglycan DD-metalloendopeptidase family protein [Methyloversatilis discipulorum]